LAEAEAEADTIDMVLAQLLDGSLFIKKGKQDDGAQRKRREEKRGRMQKPMRPGRDDLSPNLTPL